VRGLAKQYIGNLDGAIADLTMVIGFKPGNLDAYFMRGLAERTKGDLAGAITDYGKIIERDPVNENAHGSRGCLFYCTRDFTNALADFNLLTALNPPSVSPHIWVWLIRARSGDARAATTELQSYLAGPAAGHSDAWACKIGQFLAGRMTGQELLAAAESPDSKTEAQRLGQFYFYAGSKRLSEGDKDIAADYFKKCLAEDKKTSLEYICAAADLNDLKSTNYGERTR
jgi:lipoprotein NlpI